MDNAQKAIMLGVGLFITIIVIAAVMAITGIGQDLIGQGQSQLSGISGQLATQVQASYDQVRMSGSQVRSAVNKYYNDSNLAVYVASKMPSSGTGNEVYDLSDASDSDGTPAKPFVSSMVYLNVQTGSNIAVNGKGNDLKSITIDSCSLDTSSNRKPLSDITGAIGSTAQFKSVLITNQATGNIVGILFQRYQ